MFEQISESDKNFLNSVRTYGTRLARYDKVIDDKHTETESVFVYEYGCGKVIIFMKNGEYESYYIYNVVEEEVKLH